MDTILKLIRLAGDYVSEDVWYRVIQIVINRQDIQGYAAKTCFEVCEGVWFMCVRVCGFMCVRVCGFMCMRVCGFMCVRVCGFMCVRVCGFIVRVCGFMCEGVCVC